MKTHTKTYTIGHPWASTTPWECLVRETNCISPTHRHSPLVNDLCAWPGCQAKLRESEVCYAVIEVAREERLNDFGEAWVCWRHVHPDDGPIKVDPSAPA